MNIWAKNLRKIVTPSEQRAKAEVEEKRERKNNIVQSLCLLSSHRFRISLVWILCKCFAIIVMFIETIYIPFFSPSFTFFSTLSFVFTIIVCRCDLFPSLYPFAGDSVVQCTSSCLRWLLSNGIVIDIFR